MPLAKLLRVLTPVGAWFGNVSAKGTMRILRKAGPGASRWLHPDGETALHIASARGHVKTVEAMAALPSVDTQARDRYGRTALDRARVETNGAYDAALAPLLGGKRDAEAGSKTSTGDPEP